jgi:hypothetical protein
MPARRPLPLYVNVTVFLMAIVMVLLSRQLLRQPTELSHTLTELTQLLSQNTPELYVVPVCKDTLENGIYLCTQLQPLEQLAFLPRNSIGAGRWQGVVFCEGVRINDYVIEEQELQSWGEHGMRIGSLLFFGDPALLDRIHKAILKSQGS